MSQTSSPPGCQSTHQNGDSVLPPKAQGLTTPILSLWGRQGWGALWGGLGQHLGGHVYVVERPTVCQTPARDR